MAAVKQFFGYTGFSRQLSKRLIFKCCLHGSSCTERRWLSLLMLERLSLHVRTSHPKSYSLFQPAAQLYGEKYRHNIGVPQGTLTDKIKDLKARTLHKIVDNDPEFVSEKVTVPHEYMKDLGSFDEMIEKMKEKTGVMVRASNKVKDMTEDGDGRRQWNVLIGGTRHEVQKAVSYLKSLLNPEPQKQRSVKSQEERLTNKHLEEKDKPIWAYYRRNFKGQKPPMRTRKRCIRGKGEKQTVSGNPCPLCRLYLGGGYELDYKDIDLLSQFISPHTGEVFETAKTGLCRVQHGNLVKSIEMAKDYGLLPYTIPGPRSIVKPPQTAQIPRNVRLK